jgi:ferritin
MGRFPQALHEQIAREFAASQQYIAIAAYYDSETLPQLAGHFYRQAVEERNHAMMIVQYLLDSDESVAIPGVEAPRSDFSDPVAPVELALGQEKQVTAQIVELAKLAREEGDLVGEQFIAWFLEEQREEVSGMSDLLNIVRRAADANILLVEEYLARVGVGEEGGGPEANAPPAAGGAL